MEQPSTQDAKYLAALRTHWKANKTFPSLAKLCNVVGLSSTSSVFALVSRLSDAGFLERKDGRVAPGKKFFALPLGGSIRAGLPQPQGQDEPELITLDEYIIDQPGRTTLHRVKGESMRDAGILDGDLVAVEHNSPTKPGDIVAAIVDDELTIKTLCLDGDGKYYLEPANPEFKPIRPSSSLELLGLVVGVVRRTRR